MVTFTLELSGSSWTEVLEGNRHIAFDLLAATPIEVYMTESAATPSAGVAGNMIQSFDENWDFQGTFDGGVQRIWLRGRNSIRGVRG